MIGKPKKKRRRSREDQVVGLLVAGAARPRDQESCRWVELAEGLADGDNKMSGSHYLPGVCCAGSQRRAPTRSALPIASPSRRPPVFRLPLLIALIFLATLCGQQIDCRQQRGKRENADELAQLRQSQLHNFGQAAGKSNSLTVQTKHGKFRGVQLTDRSIPYDMNYNTENAARDDNNNDNYINHNDDAIVGYLGIRYASAPIKRLRFMPPTAYYYSANLVHDAQQFGPICMQRFPVNLGPNSNQQLATDEQPSGRLHRKQTGKRSATSPTLEAELKLASKLMPSSSFAYLRPLLRRLAQRDQSEDCLNLNIYAPLEALEMANIQQHQQSAPLLPVLVIIHGESFDFGAGSTINGFKMVQQQSGAHKLIAVTFNYRLNILGFPPKLMGATRGNLGLMDQVAALHWIKDNIRSFGGSPGNITIMGTKRAATFVNLLMLSPLAKGLFRRAIMEDGSALSPLVASNQLPLATSSLTGTHGNNHFLRSPPSATSSPLSPAVQHMRLLAKLCDCPIYLLPSQSTTLGNSSINNNNNNSLHANDFSTSVSTTSQQTTNSTAPGKLNSYQNRANLADESKTNAQTFECLRQKPVELLMRPLPLDLLHLDQASGQIHIDSRLLAAAASNRTLHADWSQHQRQLDALGEKSGAAQWVPIEAQQLRKLVILAREFEAQKRVAPLGETLEQQQQQDSDATSGDAFSAIYAPPQASARPLFGPAIDGTIVPDEDIATLMLRPAAESPFSQRDLLIGLSRPVISFDISDALNGDDEDHRTSDNVTLGLDNPLYLRFSLRMEKLGLSSEQAIEMVNLFVRSFYRYHNQEITNSIINHYLSSIGLRHQLRLKSRKSTTPTASDESEEVSRVKLAAERQVLILESLTESFQDALVSVPVIKTALIHSTRQLDTLVDAFVGQNFEKWKRRQTVSSATDGHDEFERHKLMEHFSNFAKTLMTDPNWPLELKIPDGIDGSAKPMEELLLQPKATYLYQLDSSALVKLLRRLVKKLELDSLGGDPNRSSGWRSLLMELRGLQLDLEANSEFNYSRPLSLACGLEFEEDLDSDLEDSPFLLLAHQLNNWICAKFNSLISSFVATGHMKPESNKSLASAQNGATTPSEQVARFDDECLGARVASVMREDHHSVSAKAGSRTSSLSDRCQRHLRRILFNYITSELSEPSSWPIFNVFKQEVATLPGVSAANDSIGGLWNARPIHDANPVMSFDEKSTFLSRASFWSNFIPALNCSKTQPVMPNSLLMSSSFPLAELTTNQSASPLLNLNLAFNCQNGAKTVLTIVESTADVIRRQLLELRTLWLTNRASQGENHHTLRMANISQTNEETEHEKQQTQQQQQQQQQDTQDLGNNGSSLSLLVNNNGNSRFLISNDDTSNGILLTRFLNSLSYSHFVLLCCGLLVTLTLAAGACVVMKQRVKKQTASVTDPKVAMRLQPEMANSTNGFEAMLPISLINDASQASTSSPSDNQQVELANYDGSNSIAYVNGNYQMASGPVGMAQSQQLGSRCPSHSSLTTPTTINTNNTSTVASGTETIRLQQQEQAQNCQQPISLQISSESPGSFANLIACSSDLNGHSSGDCGDQLMPIMMPIVTAEGQYETTIQQSFGSSTSRSRQRQQQQVVGQPSYSTLNGSDSDQLCGAWHSNGYLSTGIQHANDYLLNGNGALANGRNHSASSAQSSSFTSSLSATTNLSNGQTKTMKKRVKISDPHSLSSGCQDVGGKRAASRSILTNNSTLTKRNTHQEFMMDEQHATYCPVHSGQTIYLADGTDGQQTTYYTTSGDLDLLSGVQYGGREQLKIASVDLTSLYGQQPRSFVEGTSVYVSEDGRQEQRQYHPEQNYTNLH